MPINRRQMMAGLAAAATARPMLAQPTPAAEVYPLALGRPHIDFIRSQLAPSRVLGATNSQPGVTGTPLSYDAKGTRAVTVIFRFPQNWSMTRPHYVNSDQEFYVLEGELEINGTLYRRGDYAYLPAGLAHTSRSSGPGATLLNFYEGEHLAFYEPTPAGMYQPEKLIRKLVSEELPWQVSREPAFATLGPDVREKRLRHDAATGESTWLIDVGADAADAGPLLRPTVSHAVVEEMYVLRGEIATPRGKMTSGAYAWRAPGQPRGPWGSRTGYQLLVRSRRGALATTLSPTPVRLVWDAPYDPAIPENMKSFAFGTPTAATVY